MLDPRWASTVVILASVVLIAIRAPYGHLSRRVPVATSLRGGLEASLLTLAWIGFFLPLIWAFTDLLDAADFELRPAPFAVGVACYVLGLWLFWRSHADLGRNWSITLELREGHELVTRGVYTRVRHPMYSALLLYSLGQALVLPNWIAGPSYLLVMGLLVACRLGPEERMMLAQFGAQYADYQARTKRLLPGIL